MREEDWREDKRRYEDEQREKELLAKQAIQNARIRRQQVAAHLLCKPSVYFHNIVWVHVRWRCRRRGLRSKICFLEIVKFCCRPPLR